MQDQPELDQQHAGRQEDREEGDDLQRADLRAQGVREPRLALVEDRQLGLDEVPQRAGLLAPAMQPGVIAKNGDQLGVLRQLDRRLRIHTSRLASVDRGIRVAECAAGFHRFRGEQFQSNGTRNTSIK